MYKGIRSRVRVRDGYSWSRSSAELMLEALSRDFHIGCLCELQYADDLMIIARVPGGTDG